METTETNDAAPSSSMAMAPPPNRSPTKPAAAISMTTTGDRHMNDTTMPPPGGGGGGSRGGIAVSGPRYNNKPSGRKTAVDVRSRGPKFGLHDWKRLLANAKDLSQRKGAPLRRDIPKSEVKKHNKVYDGWTILRGKVYNLGPYLAYHPGGQEILEKILGKDATTLFDKYHRWVSIDGLIGPLLLGAVGVDVPPPISVDGNGDDDDDDDEEEDNRIFPIPK